MNVFDVAGRLKGSGEHILGYDETGSHACYLSRGAVDALAAPGTLRRTDRDGAILVREGGAGFQVRTWRELSRGRRWGERVRWAVLGW